MGKQDDSDGRSLLERLKDTVGRELVFQSPDPISSSSIRQYALAIGDFNPLYTDREFANAHGLKDVMAPPTLVCDTWQYIESDSERNLDDRGDLVGRGPGRVLEGLRAGNEYEFFRPIHPDDVITARSVVKDVYERIGRSGSLIFQVTKTTFHNQHGQLLAQNTETLFYRPDGRPDGAAAGDS